MKTHLTLSLKLILLLIVASLIPLVLFGLLSIGQVRKGTTVSVREGNHHVSIRAAAEIQQYVSNATAILSSLSENLNHSDFEDWQKERILKNYKNRFEQFSSLSLRQLDGTLISTSDLSHREMTPFEKQALSKTSQDKNFLSQVFIKNDLTPAMIAIFPVKRFTETKEVLIAELNLMHMWYLVDSIRIGEQGVLHVVDTQGRLIATGDGDRQPDVFQQKEYEYFSHLKDFLSSEGSLVKNKRGGESLILGAQLPAPLSWTILVEEPTTQAYALSEKITLLLAIVMIVILILVSVIGYLGGKQEVVTPIHQLIRATEEIARGNLDYRTPYHSHDELGQLARAFDLMAIRLKQLQEKLIIEERHALFGRIASGLAHDLKHPIQSIESYSRLMERLYEDPDFRQKFRQTMEREFSKINRFLEDLKNLTQEIPHHPISLRLGSLLHEVLSTFDAEATQNQINVSLNVSDENITLSGDPFSLNRAFSNLISNAVQAMPEGGHLVVSLSDSPNEVIVEIADTGMGIPPERIGNLFDEFVTTKQKGLGLGLAVTQRMILKNGGRIEVESTVGKGTKMIVRFLKIS